MDESLNDPGALSGREKRALLAELLRKKARQATAAGPAAPNQKALWFLHQSDPSGASYNTAFAVRVRSPIDAGAARAAFRALVDRHPALRTTFAAQDGESVAVTHAHLEPGFAQHDARTWTEAELLARVADDYRRPFDLERGPLVRLSLFSRDERNHVLLLAIHHIACDAWSIWLLASEFRLLYPALAGGAADPLPPSPPPYSDFVRWQAELLDGPEGQRLAGLWCDQLAGASGVLDLPTDRPRPPVQSRRGASHAFRLDAGLVGRLEALGRTQGATLYTVLLAAFQVLLHRYSGQDDILVGSPVAGRTRAVFANTVGYFTNTLAVRADLAGDPRFIAFLGRVRQAVLSALSNQEFPFPMLVERLQPGRDPSRSPLVQVLFVLQEPPRSEEFWDLFAPGRDGARVSWGGLEVEPFELAQMEGQFELTLELTHARDSLGGVLKYSTELYDPATIARMEGHYRALLEGLLEDPQRRVSALPLLPAAEAQQVLVEWNRTRRPLEGTACLHGRFEEQVRRSPDAVAVEADVDDGGVRSLSYAELNARANRLAHRLRALGVGPDVPVGICAERSCEMMVGLFGILKAGGAYVPFDPSYPRERLEFMAADARPPVVLTQAHLAELVATGPEVILLDADGPALAASECAEDPPHEVGPHHLAYIIYTSGSTGRPKGAMNTHLGICNRLQWMQEAFGLGPDDRVLQKTPISFDVSVWELFWPLLVGARLVMARPGGHQDQAYLVDAIERRGITTLHFVPSMLGLFLEAPDLSRCRGLRRVICSGEALSTEHQRRFFDRLGGVALSNLYGPTEAAVDVTCWHCRADDDRRSVPIGRPIANTQIYLLDRQGQPVPAGIPGELFIGGDNVARGYLHRPGLTAEKFVPDPFSTAPGARLYRTGDLARFLPDGTIEYLHRLDHQVKIRGCRVELGEVEAVLGRHAGVRDCAVAAEVNGGDDLRLVAYVVPRDEPGPTVAELRAVLAERLPEYMIPSAFVMREALPLSPSGKVDRLALARTGRAGETGAATRVPPRSQVERLVTAIWREVLHTEEVGVHDNFFELGGHSLLLGRVQNRLRDAFGQTLTMVEMFQHPTVSALARRLAGDEPAPETSRPSRSEEAAGLARDEVAIIGMAGRFPGAGDVATFWSNLCAGKESITFFSEEELRAAGVEPEMIRDPSYVPARGVLAGADGFDAAFFGVSPRDAEIMDVQHRVFLECAWAALEDAGHGPPASGGAAASVGVFAGTGMSTYFLHCVAPHRALAQDVGGYQLLIANDKDFLPTRASYKLNLKGPSVSVQTACSTSLVAVHLACRSLLGGECDLALAGGVSISVPQEAGYLHQQDSIFSPDGHCRAFDARARGTVGGSGAGVVVLKRLRDAEADGDPIRAVIRGSAINNDGALKAGFTAPSLEGQAAAIAAALDAAGLSPDAIGYVEAHGTGTALGDPIEIAALNRAFGRGESRRRRCLLGSVKTNIGHLDAAAGVAGLIKAVLALEHRQIPPSLHFETPNPEIDFAGGPFSVVTELTDWPDDDGPRRAGVSSFGIGGTNAHVVLEEAPAPRPASPTTRPGQVLVLSARTPAALDAATTNLGAFLEGHPEADLADVAYTLAVGRSAFRLRRALVCETAAGAAGVLRGPEAHRLPSSSAGESGRPVAFLFPGQGSDAVNVGAGLQSEPAFAEALDLCAERLRAHAGIVLRAILFPDPGRAAAAAEELAETAVAQPVLFALEYALARLWMSWGVQPQALLGHSLGEYVAACLAGVFSLEDALDLVADRGRLLQDQPPGAMLAIPLPEADVRPLLSERIALAAVNGPRQCVVSGARDEVEALRARLEARTLDCRLLRTSRAFHSHLVEPALAPFAGRVARVALKPPAIPFVSNVTGDWITAQQATDPSYWARHLRATVRFADGVRTLEPSSDADGPGPILLEVGPGRTLTTLARQAVAADRDLVALNGLPHPQDRRSASAAMAEAAGRLWAAGGPLDWDRYYAHERRRRVALPSYPFEHRRYWIDPPARESREAGQAPGPKAIADWFYLPSWERSLPPDGPPEAGAHWLLFVDPCGLGEALARRLREAGVEVSCVHRGAGFARRADGEYTLAPGDCEDYDRLLHALREEGRTPRAIVHLWNVTPEPGDAAARDLSFYSLLFLAQALGTRDLAGPCPIVVVSNHLHDVTGAERLDPAKALLLGPVTVVPQEYEDLRCTSVDVEVPDDAARRDALAARLVAEAAAEAPDAVVAYRGGHRWVQTFVPAPLKPQTPRVRDEGVYLITGGTGGVGLELAEWLARQASGCKLALISRSGWPPRRTAAEPGGNGSRRTDPETGRRERLDALGAKVLVLQADVSDPAQLGAAVRRVRQQFGEIHGVIHAAGIAGGGLIPLKTRADAQRELAAKVDGTVLLERLLAEAPLDFFVLCSSQASATGGLGQVSYCATAAFLDAWAVRRAARGDGTRVVAIDWDRWDHTGMAAAAEALYRELTGQDLPGGMAAAEGADAFGRILASASGPRIVVSTRDFPALVRQSRAFQLGGVAARPRLQLQFHPRPELAGAYVAPADGDERRIAEVWQEELGIERIGAQDDFFALGGDSLIAIRLVSRLRQALHAPLDVSSLYEGPTVAALAEQVATVRWAARAGAHDLVDAEEGTL